MQYLNKHLPLFIASTATAAILSGCGANGTSGVVAYDTSVMEIYHPNDPIHLGEIPLLVTGPAPDGSSPAEVLAASQPTGRLAMLKARAADPNSDTDRLVMAFAPTLPLDLCRGEYPATSTYADKMELTVAYCRGSDNLASSQLRTSNSMGPKDAGWKNVVMSIYSNAMPPPDAETMGDMGY